MIRASNHIFLASCPILGTNKVRTRKCKKSAFPFTSSCSSHTFSTVFFPSLFCLSVNICWKVTLPDHFIQVGECVRPWPADGHTCCTSIFRMCHSILPVEFQLPFSLWSNWQSQVCAGMKKRKGRQFLANITHNWFVFFLHSCDQKQQNRFTVSNEREECLERKNYLVWGGILCTFFYQWLFGCLMNL